MSKALTQVITNQITNKDVKPKFVFTINSIDYSAYLLSWSLSYSTDFGSASATFSLLNESNIFGTGGASQIDVGDIVELSENYAEDTTDFKRFYGFVQQRSIAKDPDNHSINLVCLDYISSLQFLDIDLAVEGTKIDVTNETLTPNYLPSPNEDLAQVFDFANDSLAQNPPPVIAIEDVANVNEDPQYDGFEIIYSTGQLKLGVPLNARYNYNLKARSYSYYIKGVYVEDILEDILTQVDGYGAYLFGETSAQDVIDNHLTTTFLAEEATSTDTMTYNRVPVTMTILHQLSVACTAGDTTLNLDSTEGFPTAGAGTINGDEFTWTGKTGTTLTGVSGVLTHAINSYVGYEDTYSIGQIWYLTYTNVVTALTSSDFTIPSGSTINYVDLRFGRIILDSAVSIASVITCDTSYSFKTLQATGVELNQIEFRPRELANRLEAVKKLQGYLAPNYIIHTKGNDKIWAKYMNQKFNADYDVELLKDVNYLEDEDLYTRVVFYGKNNNPTNLLFNEGVDFVTTGENYISNADQLLFTYDSTDDGWYIYNCALTNQGEILVSSGNVIPKVWIDGVLVANVPHNYDRVDVDTVDETISTYYDAIKSKSWWGGVSISGYNRTDIYTYQVHLKHVNIHPSASIILYDDVGNILMTIPPNDPHVNYAAGVFTYGDYRSPVSTFKSIATASYTVYYSTDDVAFDYENVRIKLRSTMFPAPNEVAVRASFDYLTHLMAIDSLGYMIDGRLDTQLQSEFFAEPPTGYRYAVLDLGSTKEVQAIDITAGFYRPDSRGKFDVNLTLTLQYSLDNVNYYNIGDATTGFKLGGGESQSFDESDLGVGFETRYLAIVLDAVGRVEYNTGRYPVCITEFAAYGDIILKGESKLIPTTELTSDFLASSGELLLNGDLEDWDSSGLIPDDWTVVGNDGNNGSVSKETVEVYEGDNSVKLQSVLTGNKNGTANTQISSSYFHGIYGTNYLTPNYASSIIVSSIRARLFQALGQPITSVYARIYTYSDTGLGTLLGTSDIINSAPSGWNTFTFSTPVVLSPNTQYFLAVYIPSSGASAGLWCQTITGSTRALYNSTWYTHNTKQGLIYIEDTTTPEIAQTVNTALYNERTVNFTAYVKSSSASSIRLIVETDDDIAYSSYHSGGGEWEQLTATITPSSSNTSFSVKSEVVLNSGIHYIDSISLIAPASTTLNVTDTTGFTEPASGETETAYVDGDEFSYTGLTSTSFTGVEISSGGSGAYDSGVYVYKNLDTNTEDIYDINGLLAKLGDRLYKKIEIDEQQLYSQTDIDRIAEAYLEEFYKNHSKNQINVLYAPYLQVGQTLHLVDAYHDIDDNFFVEAIRDNNGSYSLTLARYRENS